LGLLPTTLTTERRERMIESVIVGMLAFLIVFVVQEAFCAYYRAQKTKEQLKLIFETPGTSLESILLCELRKLHVLIMEDTDNNANEGEED